MNKKKSITIFDKNINFNNYATFKRSKILDNGTALKFIMACDVSYKVTLDCLLEWFDSPHYYWLLERKKLVKFNRETHKLNKQKSKIIKIRRILKKTALRVYLNNCSIYDVAWDTVLMACESQYEHYGGIKTQ